MARRRWGARRVPTLGIFPTGVALFTEPQMTRSEQYMAADWEYVRIVGAGHYVPIEQPERIAELIAGWSTP